MLNLSFYLALSFHSESALSFCDLYATVKHVASSCFNVLWLIAGNFVPATAVLNSTSLTFPWSEGRRWFSLKYLLVMWKISSIFWAAWISLSIFTPQSQEKVLYQSFSSSCFFPQWEQNLVVGMNLLRTIQLDCCINLDLINPMQECWTFFEWQPLCQFFNCSSWITTKSHFFNSEQILLVVSFFLLDIFWYSLLILLIVLFRLLERFVWCLFNFVWSFFKRSLSSIWTSIFLPQTYVNISNKTI